MVLKKEKNVMAKELESKIGQSGKRNTEIKSRLEEEKKLIIKKLLLFLLQIDNLDLELREEEGMKRVLSILMLF